MSKPLILTKPQAEAVYDAMSVLEGTGGRIKVEFGNMATDGVNVFEELGGTVKVVRVNQYHRMEDECYADQDAFACANGLQRDRLTVEEALAALKAEQEWRNREAAGEIDEEWDYEAMVGAKRRAAISKALLAEALAESAETALVRELCS